MVRASVWSEKIAFATRNLTLAIIICLMFFDINVNQRYHWAREFERGNPVGKGKKVITDLYKPLTIQININLMLKAIHSVACNNIRWQTIPHINNLIGRSVFSTVQAGTSGGFKVGIDGFCASASDICYLN
jgi:hypothetical protein